MKTNSRRILSFRRVTGWTGGGLVLAFALRLFLPVSTAPFRDMRGGLLANSIAVAERWAINGSIQSVMLRSRNLSNPVLIWISDLWCETPVLRHFNAELENDFVVVYWCQRYSGQSLDPFAGVPTKLSLGEYIADLAVLVEMTCARFHKEKVVLIGHSSGSVLGLLYTQQHPEHVVAYIGVGQSVNLSKSLARSYQFALAQAHCRQNREAIVELDRIGPPPYKEGSQANALRKWVITFGGAFHAGLSYSKLAFIGAGAREANWRDGIAFLLGDHYTLGVASEMQSVAFDEDSLKFDVPIFLLSGRYDHRADASLAQDYLNHITAPQKVFVWFEQSAHSPPFEEPEKFNAWIKIHVRPLTDIH